MTLLQDVSTIVPTAVDTFIALPALENLFRELNEQGLRYCHWKSNVRLEDSLMGKTDLDLLIDPVDAERFEQILFRQDIKLILAPAGKQYPGLEHYLGFDSPTGRLFHLHVHYKLVLGEQFVKNYHLPLEQVFLDSVYLRHGVKIPLPQLELIVLSMRALLKYRDRDVVKDIFKIRSSGLPQHILDEFQWLLAQTSIYAVARTLTQLPFSLPTAAIVKFLETIITSPRAGLRLFGFRSQVRWALHSFQRQDRLRASAKYFQELWRRRSGWRLAPERKMTRPRLGLTIALVGVDGAGKSTLCRDLSHWLGWKMDAPLYYLGSKQPSRRSEWLYLLFRMARRSQREMDARFGANNLIARGLTNLRQVLLYCHHLSIGYDRLTRYQVAKRQAQAGSIVIFDRFPFETPFDGPEIHVAARGQNHALAASFLGWEQALYQHFKFPDLLVLLKVSPQVSLQRKPDHPPETIAAKNQALTLLIQDLKNSPSRNWRLIDADGPYEEVLLQAKRQIWAMV